MAEVYIDPDELQTQIDEYREKTNAVAAFKYSVSEGDLLLSGIEKYLECVDAMNGLLKAFSEFALLDADSLDRIKNEWLNLDEDMANKTLADVLTEKITGR